jgi:hypothetical protein
MTVIAKKDSKQISLNRSYSRGISGRGVPHPRWTYWPASRNVLQVSGLVLVPLNPHEKPRAIVETYGEEDIRVFFQGRDRGECFKKYTSVDKAQTAAKNWLQRWFRVLV